MKVILKNCTYFLFMLSFGYCHMKVHENSMKGISWRNTTFCLLSSSIKLFFFLITSVSSFDRQILTDGVIISYLKTSLKRRVLNSPTYLYKFLFPHEQNTCVQTYNQNNLKTMVKIVCRGIHIGVETETASCFVYHKNLCKSSYIRSPDGDINVHYTLTARSAHTNPQPSQVRSYVPPNWPFLWHK